MRFGPSGLVALPKLTKPAPPPPKFVNAMRVLPKSERWSFKQCGKYVLPMAGEYMPAWKQVLRDCNYPTTIVLLDFESYFDDDLSMKKLSTIEYITHPDFEVLGVASLKVDATVNFPDYENTTIFWTGEEATEQFIRGLQSSYGPNLERCIVVCHNAPFDCNVLAIKYGICPRYVIDTLGLARAWNSRTKNDLEKLAPRLGLEEKGETEEFKGLSFRTRFKKPKKGRAKGPKLPVAVPPMTDEQASKLGGYACNDGMREWEVFTILLPRLSRPQVELRIMQHTLEMFTKPTLGVDFDKGAELVQRMHAEVDRVLGVVGLTREEISGDKSFERWLLNELEGAGDHPQKYYKVGKRGYLLAIAKTDPERELLENHECQRVRDLMAARIAVDSWPTHIARVERIMRIGRCLDGKLPVPLKYHGAHTGRWSGGEKINLQNLGSRGHELVNAVRELIVALPGDTLVIADLSAIEARVLAWIAGQWDLVEKFANDAEIYCDFASKVLGFPVRKPRKHGGIPAVEARMKWARNSIGKVGILGCGYGMGAAKVVGYAQGAVDADMAQKIVDTYRGENTAIVQFWRDIERAFTYTAKYHRPCEMARGLRFDSSEDCDVILTLPSGREIHYVKVRVEAGTYGDTLKTWNDQEHCWVHLWGGVLTENVVQAISRDLIAETVLRVEERGYHVALHVHDEIVGPAKVEAAEETMAVFLEELRRRPSWGPELPLNAEAVISPVYGGH